MTREELKKAIDALAPDQIELVEAYVRQFVKPEGPFRPVKLRGLLKGIELTEADIAAARKEMWSRFHDDECHS